jgi:hypothetical protein
MKFDYRFTGKSIGLPFDVGVIDYLLSDSIAEQYVDFEIIGPDGISMPSHLVEDYFDASEKSKMRDTILKAIEEERALSFRKGYD